MPTENFHPCCPNCYSREHRAYQLVIQFGSQRLSLGTPYGQALRHCQHCGLKFNASRAVELRELEPVEPPRDETYL